MNSINFLSWQILVPTLSLSKLLVWTVSWWSEITLNSINLLYQKPTAEPVFDKTNQWWLKKPDHHFSDQSLLVLIDPDCIQS